MSRGVRSCCLTPPACGVGAESYLLSKGAFGLGHRTACLEALNDEDLPILVTGWNVWRNGWWM